MTAKTKTKAKAKAKKKRPARVEDVEPLYKRARQFDRDLNWLSWMHGEEIRFDEAIVRSAEIVEVFRELRRVLKAAEIERQVGEVI